MKRTSRPEKNINRGPAKFKKNPIKEIKVRKEQEANLRDLISEYREDRDIA